MRSPFVFTEDKTMKLFALVFVVLLCNISIANDTLDGELRKEFECMAHNLHHEARGESARGLRAIANVVLNRKKAPNFPDTICGVIHQKSQFSWVGKKYIDFSRIDTRIKKIAYEAVVNNSLHDNTGGALFFKTITSNSTWNYQKLIKTVIIGNHVFYK